MKVLTIVGEDAKGKLQEFHVVNPQNVVIHKGTISKPRATQDAEGKPILYEVERTFVRIGGQPLFSPESVEDVIAKAKAL